MTNVKIVPGPETAEPYDVDNAHFTQAVPARFVGETVDPLEGLSIPDRNDALDGFDHDYRAHMAEAYADMMAAQFDYEPSPYNGDYSEW